MKKQIGLLITLISTFIFSQTTVTYAPNPTNAQINAALVGSNITITGGNLNNGNRTTQIATFTNGNGAALEMNNGAFLGTGTVTKLLTKNTVAVNSDIISGTTYTDADLSKLDATAIYDVVSYSFTVTLGPKASTLNIKYQFGSEEYPDYVGSAFNDVIGFFVTGPGITGTANLAKLPNNNPISINKVNYGVPGASSPPTPVATYDGTQASLYTNNGHNTNQALGKLVANTNPGPFPVAIQFNGVTKLINYGLSGLTPGGTYVFKIVIADVGDQQYDSGVFINTIYGTATIVSNNDTYSVLSGSSTSISVLNNDTVNSASPASLNDILLTQVSSTNSGIALNPATGLINVAPGTPPGVYTVTYQICDQTYTSNCKTAIATVNVLINDSDNDGYDDFYDLDDDNDGILDTIEGQCINTSNPTIDGFDSPLVATINGNNIQSINPYNGWGTEAGGANAFNVIRVNGTSYFSGPDIAQSGSQYIDINASSTYVYKDITLATPTVFSASAWFANRETSNVGYTPWSTNIQIRNQSTNVIVSQGNTINFTAALGNKNWYKSTIAPTILPAGNYRIRMFVGDFGHFDSISYCFSTDTDSDGISNHLDLDSDGDGCPDALEGDENVTNAQLSSNRISGTVDANGVPNIVNSGGGAADIGGDQGQGLGSSQNAGVQDTQCLTSFGCNTNLYLSQGANTTVYNVNTTSNPFTFPAIGTASGINYNAIGVNPLDGFIYGLLANTNQLIRVSADGKYNNLGAITGLPDGVIYNSGEIDKLGNYYVKVNNQNSQLYRVNLSTLSATLINLTASVNLPDMAFRVTDNLIYGVNSVNGQLVSINPSTGTVTGIGITPGVVNFGAMFGSSTGEIFGADNTGGFYQFNLTNGQRVLISGAPASTANDGAHCVTSPITFSADLYITKTDGQTAYTSGKLTTYTVVAGNNGPFGVLNATVSDLVPSGIPSANVSYTAVVAGGATTNVVGTQTGAINDLVSLPVGGTVTYTILVNIPSNFYGNLVNTATIISPANTNDSNPSNNSATDTNTGICYLTAQTTGTTLNTNHGISTLSRTNNDNNGWPMVRKGAWTVLESKTKGFVVNRLTNNQINSIPSTELREGMMIYNIDQDCLQINTDGTPTGWKCFNNQTCPN